MSCRAVRSHSCSNRTLHIVLTFFSLMPHFCVVQNLGKSALQTASIWFKKHCLVTCSYYSFFSLCIFKWDWVYGYFLILCWNIYVSLTFLAQQMQGAGTGSELIIVFVSYEDLHMCHKRLLLVSHFHWMHLNEGVLYQDHEYNELLPEWLSELLPFRAQGMW